MKDMTLLNRFVTPAACLAALLTLAAGCKQGPDDAALTQKVNSQLSEDTSISGQPVQATVQAGIVTLNGSVQNDAQKTIAARDAAAVLGVRQVQNNIAIGFVPAPESAAITPPAPPPAAPAPIPAPAPRIPTPKVKPQPKPQPIPRDEHYPAPIERPAPPPPMQTENHPPPVSDPAPPPPVAPPPPAMRTVNIPSGTTIPVRVTQTLDSATTEQGTSFSGVVASDILIDGVVAIPAGSPVAGQVDEVHEAAHYKGSASLTVSLASITRRGEHIAITTDPYSVTGKGRGTNTAEKVGGGAAVGAILGGIFGGGKGAAIGAAAGGGAGAGVNTVTRGQQVQIPSETVVRFHLASPFNVRVRGDGEKNSNDGALQPHPTE